MKRIFLLILLLGLMGCGQETGHYGHYSIGRDQGWFPLDLGQHTPNINAFTNALVQDIAKIENVPLEIIDINWVQLFEFLDNKEIAGVFSSLSPNVITEAKYSFSDPFLHLGPVLVVPYESEAKSLADFEGGIVAVNQFDESILIVQDFPSIIVKLYRNMALSLTELNAGKIDGVLMPNLDAHAFVPYLYPNKLKIVTGPLNNKALRLITLKEENQKLMRTFNRGLKEVHKTSHYSELREKFKL